ncbi:MAG: D-tyrosyl-tRNA(Tyr) deacylase [Chloroflexi bacterium RBG_13_53_26]|nr:MAG: D-tyrosyl-tRNA(Tyr) deacylase [Chloroflexi bacterium RBG_13_53_26]
MKLLLQRVIQASVSVGGDEVAQIGEGLVCLVGVAQGDTEADVRYLVDKTINLRIFSDEAGKFNLSLLDVNGQILAVSQFTLLADTRKGRRPSFIQAALPVDAEVLFNRFVELAKAMGLRVETGCFQQHMLVRIHNDGPVTVLLDSRDSKL